MRSMTAWICCSLASSCIATIIASCPFLPSGSEIALLVTALQRSHHIDNSLVDVQHLALRQLAGIDAPNMVEDGLLASGLIDRQRRLLLEFADGLGRLRTLTDELNDLLIQL